MTNFLTGLHHIVWGAPTLILILGTGLFLSVRTRFVQLRLLPRSLRQMARSLRRGSGEDGISPFQALCTALAATVGTGNLVGVAGAICLGGPGAIFWMWVCGILGMTTKYAEVTLALGYRVREHGEYLGGPMYMITRGMGPRWRFLAAAYAVFGIAASFGVGNATQVSAVVTGVNAVLRSFGRAESLRRNLAMGLLLAVAIGAVLLGGAKQVGRTAEKLIPFVSGGYILLCLGVLILRGRYLPQAFSLIFDGAFSPRSVTGGILGSAFRALSVGCSRGVFTNESGMGTASMAHASAQVSHPAEQGLLGIVEVFLDTIVICTLTALVILTAGVAIPYGTDMGGSLTSSAFCAIYGGWVNVFLAGALACFAIATVLGWGLYGCRCAQFLLGPKAWKGFALLQALAVIPASVGKAETVWLLAEILNALMSVPNLIALAALSPELVRLTKEYERRGTPCKSPSTPTAASPPPCGNSTPWRWPRKRKAKKSTT